MSNRPSAENIKKFQTLRKIVSKFIQTESPFEHIQKLAAMKRGNFDRRGNFDQSDSFVKGATVPTQNCLFVASVFMEIDD